MSNMLNKKDKLLSCRCCTAWQAPAGRAYEDRQWHQEWFDERPDYEAHFRRYS